MHSTSGFFRQSQTRLCFFTVNRIAFVVNATPPFPVAIGGRLWCWQDCHLDKGIMDDGMILNQPTIFGYNAKSNQFLAGGEAGSETVVGTQNLMDMIQEAVNNVGSGNGDSEATRALLEAIFNWMRNGGLYKLLIDVLTNGVEFEFDNREIARLVKKYA